MKQDRKEQFLSHIQENEKIIFKICHLYSDTQHDFEDLYQEILLQLWKSYATFSQKAKFSTWLYRVSMNTALTKLRREKYNPTHNTLSNEHLNIPELSQPNKNDAIMAVKELFQPLNQIEKAIMTLYLDDYSHEEIAGFIGITKTNVATKISRIRNKMAQFHHQSGSNRGK